MTPVFNFRPETRPDVMQSKYLTTGFKASLRTYLTVAVYQVVGYYVTIGSDVQVVGFFDVAARLRSGDGSQR